MDTTPDITFTPQAAGGRFGLDVAAFDVNKDGFRDVLIGATANGEAGANSGKVYLYTGSRPEQGLGDGSKTGLGSDNYEPKLFPAPQILPVSRKIVRGDSLVQIRARAFRPDVKRVYVEISGKRYPLFDDGKQVDGTRGDGVYGSRPLKVGEDTSFTVYAQYFSVTTKARATIRSTSNLFKLLSSVDNLFYQVFERRPSISEHAFWLERVRRGEKVTSLELLGAMQWHRLRGRTK